MTVTIITEKVIAHRRADDRGVSGAGPAVTPAWYRAMIPASHQTCEGERRRFP
jgi:hypothetical protein